MDLSKIVSLKTFSPSLPADAGQSSEISPSIKKTQKVAKPYLEASSSFEAPKKQRKIQVLAEETNLLQRIDKLKGEWNELTPEDTAEELIELHQRITVLAQGKETKTCLKIQKQWKDLFFRFVFPIMQELDDESTMSFAQNIRLIAQTILEQNSLQPFQELSSLQQKEIYQFATKEGGLK